MIHKTTENNRHETISPDEDVIKFRMEIQELKELEAKEGKKVHFKAIDPKDLTEEDLALYRNLKNETLTVEEIRIHERNLMKSGAKIGDSRTTFSSYLRNKLLMRNAEAETSHTE